MPIPEAPERGRSGQRQVWRQRTRRWKQEARALYLAARHPGVPWYAKAWLMLLLAYVFSPIDPVPDFLPVLGHLDELVLVPLGLAVARRMIPAEVLEECRRQAAAWEAKPRVKVGAVVVALTWLALALALAWLGWRVWRAIGPG